jgi:hypothetical protein
MNKPTDTDLLNYLRQRDEDAASRRSNLAAFAVFAVVAMIGLLLWWTATHG